MKNFLFPKLKRSSSRYFYQVLWQFLSSGFLFGIFSQTLAAAGGEMRPNYFNNSHITGKENFSAGLCSHEQAAGL